MYSNFFISLPPPPPPPWWCWHGLGSVIGIDTLDYIKLKDLLWSLLIVILQTVQLLCFFVFCTQVSLPSNLQDKTPHLGGSVILGCGIIADVGRLVYDRRIETGTSLWTKIYLKSNFLFVLKYNATHHTQLWPLTLYMSKYITEHSRH